MTKSELVEAVAEKRDISKNQAESAVNCVFDAMFAALERAEGVELRGFGSFTIRKYKPYKGRNPKNGKAVSVSQKQLPFFKAGKALKALLNDGQRDNSERERVRRQRDRS
ncbi:MAG: integration host factor subunit beta [Deltaproteobacteria bacterium]|nr:integration host factor subunit beta [Deltaproteobacteria bacterium]